VIDQESDQQLKRYIIAKREFERCKRDYLLARADFEGNYEAKAHVLEYGNIASEGFSIDDGWNYTSAHHGRVSVPEAYYSKRDVLLAKEKVIGDALTSLLNWLRTHARLVNVNHEWQSLVSDLPKTWYTPRYGVVLMQKP
jgi:hypothetical protein